MLLPLSEGVVWFCAIQKLLLPLPPAHEAVPQDCQPERCSRALKTIAFAGGTGIPAAGVVVDELLAEEVVLEFVVDPVGLVDEAPAGVEEPVVEEPAVLAARELLGFVP
jgi:hypothetical protein